MHIIGSFAVSTTLEMALKQIEEEGIPKARIVAIPIERRPKPPRLFDSMHRSDGKSNLDIATIFGTIFMLLGSIYGFVLVWGPIVWGLIGLIVGMAVGYGIDALHDRRKRKRQLRSRLQLTEVFVTVKCVDRRELKAVETIMWAHFALGVGRLEQQAPIGEMERPASLPQPASSGAESP